MWLLDANMDVDVFSRLRHLLRYRWAAWVEESVQWRTSTRGRGCWLQMSANTGSTLWRVRFPSPEAVSRIRSCRGERPAAALATISRGIPCSMEETSDRAHCRQIDSVAVRAVSVVLVDSVLADDLERSEKPLSLGTMALSRLRVWTENSNGLKTLGFRDPVVVRKNITRPLFRASIHGGDHSESPCFERRS